MSDQSSYHDLYQRQRDFMDKLRLEHPELLQPERAFDESVFLPTIGITTLPAERPEGYLRLLPQDFIVEEVRKDGTPCVVDTMVEKDLVEPAADERATLFADLVKVSIPTIEAVRRLATVLGLPQTKIGFAGIKDAKALTSQQLALPGVRHGDLAGKQFDAFYLQNFSYGRGSVQPGDLQGNAFTIFVRTNADVDMQWLADRLTYVRDNGFLNYFYTQRFGGARPFSHELGRLILIGDYAGTVKEFLTRISPYSTKATSIIRKQAAAVYGNWVEMKKEFEKLPFTFGNEVKVCEWLEKHEGDWVGALAAIPQQTQIWVYAHGSLLFNKYLSQCVEQGTPIPQDLPLLPTAAVKDQQIFAKWLKEDGITDMHAALWPFKFIRQHSRTAPAKIFPKDISFNVLPEGVAVHFVLSKAVYATTFLSNIFRLRTGFPVPEWIKPAARDIKKDLEIGSSAGAVGRLAMYIHGKEEESDDKSAVEAA